MRAPLNWLMAAAVLLLAQGCETAYYGALEQLGIPKREVLVDRVAEARDSQEEAREQFASALEEFSSVAAFDGGDLEDIYERLNDEFERSEDRAEEVRDRIEAVESVSEALFDEWEEEIGAYTSDSLRRSSEQQLRQTQRRYESLVASMWKAEGRIAPVLDAFRDQVLFLKHNLNARAIASLKGEIATIEDDVAVLLQDMERAIAESDAFITEMRAGA